MNEHTPKNFALQLGALITLYVAMSSLIILLFSIINISFKDALDGYWEYSNNQDSVRYAIASLLIFFPTYLYLTRLVNQARRHESALYHTLTRWLVYLSLVVGGLIILGNGVALIMTFLNGEITARFLLKVASMVGVIGAAFWYYQKDVKGYWNDHERQSKQVGLAALFVVVVACIYGFFVIDAPSIVREQRLDEQQVSDLQAYQWRIEDYTQRTGTLPSEETLSETGTALPNAPEGRSAYRYVVTGATTYELCANFASDSTEYSYGTSRPYALEEKNYNWDHEAGEWCFERNVTVDKTLD